MEPLQTWRAVGVVLLSMAFCFGGAASSQGAASDEALLALKKKRLKEWKSQQSLLGKRADEQAKRAKELKSRISKNREKIEAFEKQIAASEKERTSEDEKPVGEAEAPQPRLTFADALAHASVAVERTAVAAAAAGQEGATGALAAAGVSMNLASHLDLAKKPASKPEANPNKQDAPPPRPKAPDTSKLKADLQKLKAATQELERELEGAEGSRKAFQGQANSLAKLAATVEKDIRRLEARIEAAETKSKAPTPKPKVVTPPKATTTPAPKPRPTMLSPGEIRPGTGLDILVSEGTEVHAIESGNVVYADRFEGLGNLVIVEHTDKSLALYGYLSEIRVQNNTRISRGRVVGRSGYIEDRDRSGFRFEMRKIGTSRSGIIDPASWLPPGVDLKERILEGRN